MKIIEVSHIDYGLIAKEQFWVLYDYGIFLISGVRVKAGRRQIKIKGIRPDGKKVKYKIRKK